ncbi:MAG: 3-oxoacyl-[acyl-carrier-protein] synthase III C-terminal domain-containing protein [Chitinophagales bacterium]|nr:hypothetical protein [Bacteroidota bacterium]MBK8682338.1 hypothetical protein [Bacteroidota bacterium]MBP8753192.1 hypothetical protein [Chitinophagales bacterium]MBP9704410.1 hypothetical protein [Chitinophagales bacterium]
MEIHGLKIQELWGIKILSTASAFPSPGRFVSNTEIHQMRFGNNWKEVFKTKNYKLDFIENELGYENRYWTHTPGTPISHTELTSADLMEASAKKALEKSGLNKNAIGLFIAVTVTSSKYTNSMGTYVAGKLGLQCPSFEIKTGCASSVYALMLAAQFIHAGTTHVLIASGETPTKVTGTDTNLLYAVGDGGAAIILSKTTDDNKGIATAFLGSEGKFSGTMGTPGLLPPNQDDLDNNAYLMQMGKESADFVKELWKGIPNILFQNSGLNEKNIDLLIPHQVNKKLLDLVCEASGIEKQNTIDLISQYGNCGSASILIALNNAVENNRIKKDTSIMLVAVGGGISYGGLILNV